MSYVLILNDIFPYLRIFFNSLCATYLDLPVRNDAEHFTCTLPVFFVWWIQSFRSIEPSPMTVFKIYGYCVA